MTDPREILAIIRVRADSARTDEPRLMDATESMLDLADSLDAEAGALYDFSGGMSDESEWLEATATRIRTRIAAALEGETDA